MLRLTTLAIVATALMACNQSEQATQPKAAPAEAQAGQSGTLIREFKITDGSVVRFRENGGTITLSLEGPIDEKERNQALEGELMRAPSMEAAFRILDASGPVPQALLDFDKRPLTASAEAGPAQASQKAPDAAGPVASASRAGAALAKTSSLDDTWDWNGDAEWWRGTVVGYKCGWHEAATYTNVTWADDWRQGWYSRGYLMAAGFTYGANAYAYIWQNGAWVQTDYIYLNPRYYVTWLSGDKTKQYRRYRVVGYGGAYARIHWGMRWDSQAPSDLGVICQS